MPSRKLLESSLLTALEDDDVVAILATVDDLDQLIYALLTAPRNDQNAAKRSQFAADLQTLREKAFGK